MPRSWNSYDSGNFYDELITARGQPRVVARGAVNLLRNLLEEVTARENVRTTRDVLPEGVWEHVNELYLYTREHAEGSVRRRHQQQFLDQIVACCQMITGLVITTLCRDHAHHFLMLERARRSLARFPVEGASRDAIHRFIDRFQLRINELNATITESWFLPTER